MLMDKIDELDEEIIDLVPENELETEIQQIDEFQERLELTKVRSMSSWLC